MKASAKGEGHVSSKEEWQAQRPPHMLWRDTVTQQRLVKDAARPKYPLCPKFCHSCHGDTTLHPAQWKTVKCRGCFHVSGEKEGGRGEALLCTHHRQESVSDVFNLGKVIPISVKRINLVKIQFSTQFKRQYASVY